MNNAVITITSVRKDGDDVDTTQIVTEGGYTYLCNGCEFTYTETDATGFEGSSTVVRIENGQRLEMQRSGTANTELLVETGKKNYCMYGTPFGDLTIGVLGKSVSADIDENGGKISVEYVMDMNSCFAGDFSLDIDVKLCS